MKLSSARLEPVVALLTRIYFDIREIEEEYRLFAGEGDFRPRIEFFHDAVRAFASQNPQHREEGGRLSVEWLAYDAECLRFLQAKPLAPFKPEGRTLSPQTGVVAVEPGLEAKGKRAGRQTRDRLTELYQHYAVLFAALLKDAAAADTDSRVRTLNQDVEEMHAVMHHLKDGDAQELTATAQHLEDDAMRRLLLAFIKEQKYKQKDSVKKMLHALKNRCAASDKEIAAIEAAHGRYALAQLGIYENSKDLLKKMAAQGMNLAGKFVEAAMAESVRERGR